MKYIYAFLFCAVATFGYSQYQIGLIPPVSPDKMVYKKVGLTEITISYSGPIVDDRRIWGNLVPYDDVWRAGANAATTIETSHEITIDNRILPAGKYAYFVIPKENGKWTVVFNKKYNLWGAFGYDQSYDVLRVDVSPVECDYTEELAYEISSANFNDGSIDLKWESVTLSLPFSTNYIRIFEDEIENRVAQADDNTKWVVYLQGAEFLYYNDIDIDLAKTWIDESEKLSEVSSNDWDEQFYPREYLLGHMYWTKAKIYANLGKYRKAVSYYDLLISKGRLFYDEEKEQENFESYRSEWKKY